MLANGLDHQNGETGVRDPHTVLTATAPDTLDPAGTQCEGLSGTTEDPGVSNVSVTK